MRRRVYPTHIEPHEIVYVINNLDKVVFSPKADGVYRVIDSYETEYFEDKDIDLIFDILKLPFKMNNYKERYEYIRRQNQVYSMETINSYDEFCVLMQTFNTNIKNSIASKKKNIIKPSFMINTEIDVNELCMIFRGLDNLLTEIPNDGWIINIMGRHEKIWKLKPKYHMTVDLQFMDNSWYDNDGNIYNDNIEADVSVNLSIKESGIYRCYWQNGKWIAKEERTDKVVPNNKHIVDSVTRLNKIDCNLESACDLIKSYYKKRYYYKSGIKISVTDARVLKYLELEEKIYSASLADITNNYVCPKILDIGTGHGKICKFVNDANITGMDINSDNIYYNKLVYPKHNWIWGDMNNIDVLPDTKFDVIIFNFSIHYITSFDTIKSILNKCGKQGTFVYVRMIDEDELVVIEHDMLSVKPYKITDTASTYLFKYSWKESEFVDNVLSSNRLTAYLKSIGIDNVNVLTTSEDLEYPFDVFVRSLKTLSFTINEAI